MGAEISKPGRYYADVSGAWTRLGVDFDANGLFWAVECDVDWRPIDGGRVYNVSDLAGCRWERVVCDGGSASVVGSGAAHSDGRSVVDNDRDSQPPADVTDSPLRSCPVVLSLAEMIAADDVFAACWRAVVRTCVQREASVFDPLLDKVRVRAIGEGAGNRFVRHMKLLVGGSKANCTTPLEVR